MASREIVSRDAEGAIHRSNYAEVAARAKRVANALDALGAGHGDRVATLAWNGHRHLEIYYGVTSSGRVLHTVNPRLFPDQIQYIMHHAEDAYVFFDPVFTPLIEALAPRLPLVRGWVALCDEKPASQDEARRAARLRGSAGEGVARLRMAAPRREHGLDALLHLRHDRQSKGRVVQLTARRCCTPSPPARPTHSASWRAIRSSPWCRSSTPTPGACRFPRRCAGRSSCSPVRGSIPKASICCLRARGAPRPSAFRRSGSTSSPGWKRTRRSSTFPS